MINLLAESNLGLDTFFFPETKQELKLIEAEIIKRLACVENPLTYRSISHQRPPSSSQCQSWMSVMVFFSSAST